MNKAEFAAEKEKMNAMAKWAIKKLDDEFHEVVAYSKQNNTDKTLLILIEDFYNFKKATVELVRDSTIATGEDMFALGTRIEELEAKLDNG